MISIGYYTNDGRLYVFAIFDGIVTRARLATEGLVGALMDAKSLQIAAEKVKDWIPDLRDPIVKTNQVEVRLGDLMSRHPGSGRTEAPLLEVYHPELKTSMFNNSIIAWSTHEILEVGMIFPIDGRDQLFQFGEFLLEFARDTSKRFEQEVLTRYQAEDPLEPSM